MNFHLGLFQLFCGDIWKSKIFPKNNFKKLDPDKINFATSSMTSELPVSCRRLPGRCAGGRAEPGGPAAGGGRARLQDCRAHRQAAQEEGPRVLPQENPLRRENCPLLVPLLQVRSLIEEKRKVAAVVMTGRLVITKVNKLVFSCVIL